MEKSISFKVALVVAGSYSLLTFSAVLAAPPGPPPAPNVPDAAFNSINTTSNIYSNSYLTLGKSPWTSNDYTGTNYINFTQPVGSYNTKPITGAYTVANCQNDAGIASGGTCWYPLIVRDEEGLAMTVNTGSARQTNLLLGSNGTLSNPGPSYSGAVAINDPLSVLSYASMTGMNIYTDSTYATKTGIWDVSGNLRANGVVTAGDTDLNLATPAPVTLSSTGIDITAGNIRNSVGPSISIADDLNNPATTSETNPTCANNGGLRDSNGTCDYPLVINDNGGLYVKSYDPIPWYYATTKINGEGINIYSRNNKGLKIHAGNDVDLYKADFDMDYKGLYVSSFDTTFSDDTTKTIDMDVNQHTMEFKVNTTDNTPDPGDSTTWYRGSYLNMDGNNSMTRLGSKYLYFGNYKASAFGGSPVFSTNLYMNNETDNAYLYMNMNTYGDTYASGHSRASDGFGTVYSVTGTPVTQGANVYGYVGSATCNSSTHRLLSCSITTSSSSVLMADTSFPLTGAYSCGIYTKNTSAGNQTVTPRATCWDPNGTTW